MTKSHISKIVLHFVTEAFSQHFINLSELEGFLNIYAPKHFSTILWSNKFFMHILEKKNGINDQQNVAFHLKKFSHFLTAYQSIMNIQKMLPRKEIKGIWEEKNIIRSILKQQSYMYHPLGLKENNNFRSKNDTSGHSYLYFLFTCTFRI